jgi:hypothetical protein
VYKIDEFDYFGYDDTVIKNTFPVTFFSKKKIDKLKEIKGQLRYFTPSVENGAVKVIEDPKKTLNVNLLSHNPQIKALIINVEKLIELKTSEKEEYQTEIKTIIFNNDLNRKLFEKCLAKLFEEHKTYNRISKQYFALYFEDPKEDFVSIKTFVGNNRFDKLRSIYRFGYSKLILLNFFKDIEDNYKLVIEIETPESIKDYNFIISDIEIPSENKL